MLGFQQQNSVDKDKQAQQWIEDGIKYQDEGEYQKAFALFEKAGNNEYALGWFFLIELYVKEKVKRDEKEIARLVGCVRAAAENGNAIGQSALGHLYNEGHGVSQDYKEAVRLYILAAEQGNPEAQRSLGWMHENGRGVPQNRQEAIRLYTLAAEQGDAQAQHNLGLPIEIMDQFSNPNITSIDLSYKVISVEKLQVITEILKYKKVLTTINLSNNRIGIEGIQAITETLKHNTTLTEINLSCNNIGDIGVKIVAEALLHNTSLTMLDLSENSINNAGTQAIAHMLKYNSSLKTINLSRNSHLNFQAIAEALKHNATLTTICFSYNCSTKALELIAEALEYNTSLISIPFADYYDDADGITDKDYNRLRLEIENKTEQNRAIKQNIDICRKLRLPEKAVFDFFLQWLSQRMLEDTLSLLINKKPPPLTKNSQSFFKRKREEESPCSPSGRKRISLQQSPQ